MVGTGVLSAGDIGVLADLPSRDTLLAQFAGALAAPLQQLAGLIQALPRNLAYGLSALIDQRQAVGRGARRRPGAGGRRRGDHRGPCGRGRGPGGRGRSRRCRRQGPAPAEAPPAEDAARADAQAADAPGLRPPNRPNRQTQPATSRPPTGHPRPSSTRTAGTVRPAQHQIRDNRPYTKTQETRSYDNGRHPDQGPDSGRHLRAVRPRAERAAQGVRGALRRDRRRPGGRGRRRPGRRRRRRRAAATRRRPSSTSSSPPPATRRSRSSRRSAP